MKWFRFYTEALDDPKVQRLPGDLFKAWVNLLCLANEGDKRGQLPSLEDVAFRLRMSEPTAELVLAQLVERGLLDSDGETYQPHNWEGRQKPSDNVTARVQKHRAKETDAETLQKRSGNAPEEIRIEEKRVEETRGERGGTPPAPTRLPTPAPKRADARPALPSAEQLVADLREWADAKGVRDILADEVDRFRDYCLSGKNGKPVTYADYVAACRKWITNPNYGHSARSPALTSPNGHQSPPQPRRTANNIEVLRRAF